MNQHTLLILILVAVTGCAEQADAPVVATQPRAHNPASDRAGGLGPSTDSAGETLELLAFPSVNDSIADNEIDIPEITIGPPFDFVPAQDRDEEILDVCEALFRHQFANNVSNKQQNATSYHLVIKGKLLSGEFLERFRGHKPLVRYGSEFRTPVGGLQFQISSWRWIDGSSVELTGGYREDGLSASDNRYLLVKRHGKWIVEEDVLEQIF